MSAATNPPGGLTLKEFELYTVGVGEWIWGTAKGAFNEKQTLAQIMTDAGISMIPVLGDVTAVRDLFAISIGLVNHAEKRARVMEWVLLVIFLFALIPVLGGVIKGVGRIALRVTPEAAQDSKALSGIADEIVAFLNNIGRKDERSWIKNLNLLRYEKEILKKFQIFCDTVILILTRYSLHFHAVLPSSMVARMEQLSNGFKQLKELGGKMLPQALRELHEKLAVLQKLIHNGGVLPIDKAPTIAVQTGQKTVTYVEEARLRETTALKIVRDTKYPQNFASADPLHADEIKKVYEYQVGYPNLVSKPTEVGEISFYPQIASASGPIKNEMLSGETLFRAFGEKGRVGSVPVSESEAIGVYWGRGPSPTTAEEWRKFYAVIDEWNLNGWLTLVRIPPGAKVPACTSTVSEQYGKSLSGQFLEGGGKQAVITAFFEKEMVALAKRLQAEGGGSGSVKLANGSWINVEIRKTQWENVAETTGYDTKVIPGASMTERLGINEIERKILRETVKQGPKEQRASENRNTK
ncbi:hypothetical protein RGU70_07925 [Herbaspirillum sp. RTI4]|uniref:hypothetical protein n=1 Tax=Herbaspirillum sp. RTI4 TaxID=3048640 RepID=UPI002AB40F07|nr:hypothetical protein [Herbaspirillum sp. RTI4]MDY7578246.1 hypothetical protein [Herbaspirillum sp. RTI4]MEA9981584.1 hypothetical protein [Herbaspirillum sp. RTI4]